MYNIVLSYTVKIIGKRACSVKESDVVCAYNNVFNADGTLKLCGRQACMDLIHAVEVVYGVVCGNIKTGVLNLEAVRQVRERW